VAHDEAVQLATCQWPFKKGIAVICFHIYIYMFLVNDKVVGWWCGCFHGYHLAVSGDPLKVIPLLCGCVVLVFLGPIPAFYLSFYTTKLSCANVNYVHTCTHIYIAYMCQVYVQLFG
jgi:hypothetical protein